MGPQKYMSTNISFSKQFYKISLFEKRCHVNYNSCTMLGQVSSKLRTSHSLFVMYLGYVVYLIDEFCLYTSLSSSSSINSCGTGFEDRRYKSVRRRGKLCPQVRPGGVKEVEWVS